ncbi:MAG: TAXI family TRAP transporter solute-binding subunit [Hyphomicrobiales bacterium]
MRIALVVGLCLLPLIAAETANAADQPKPKPSAQSIRESYRARLNENTVTIMAGSSQATDLAVVQDIAAVLDDGDALRVVPMIGKGPTQNLKDVLFMRGVDMGVTQANVLKYFARTGELGPDLANQVAYIAKLFNEEMHVLARAEIEDIAALSGKTVNIGPEGSGAEITARLVFEALGITAHEVHLDEADAIAKLNAGEIDATVVVAGKPAPVFAHLEQARGLKLLAVPYAKGLEDSYYPATLSHEDYPHLIADGERVDTVSVCAVLVSFNWASDSARYRKLDRFVDRFFSNFDAFLAAPRHPKWQQVNFAATLEGWQRSPLAQRWIDNAKTTAAADPVARERFETFLAQADAGAAAATDEERAKLFRAFVEWSKNQNKN